MYGLVLDCPACERRWPVGSHVGHFEQQALEAAACPGCGAHALRCLPAARPKRFRPATDPLANNTEQGFRIVP